MTAHVSGVREARHCQSQHPDKDVCRASVRDGVVCPHDSCDIDDGTRPPVDGVPVVEVPSSKESGNG